MAVQLKLDNDKIVQFRKTAVQVLKEAKCLLAPVDIEKVAAYLGARVLYGPYEGDALAGMLIRQPNAITIAVNSSHHKNRQRFTIAHECSHLLLHKDSNYFIDKGFSIFRRDALSATASDQKEIEANQLAAELLMPAVLLMREVRQIDLDLEDDEQIKQLAKKYAVSAQAMAYRIANVFM